MGGGGRGVGGGWGDCRRGPPGAETQFGLGANTDQFEKRFVPKLRAMLHNTIQSVAENEKLRTGIDESARALGGNILEEEYPHISSVTADILKKFKDSDLNEFIEAKVHKELEGIRINGAVVGLAAGFALYGLIEYLYLPIISLLFSL